MLDKSALKGDIKTAIETTIPKSLEQCLKDTFPCKSDDGDSMAKKFAEDFTDMFADAFATQLADAIDTYIKCISIQGTIITVGSPITQTCQVFSLPLPTLNGKIPMTLGVS